MSRHVAVDVRMARDSGIGTYIRHILPPVIAARPAWKFTLLGRRREIEALGWATLPNVAVRDCTSRIYTVAEQVELKWKSPASVDLFWSPHYNIPLLGRGPLVVTVHDVLHLAKPEYLRNPLKRAYARAMFEAVQRRATRIVTVSDFSRVEYRRLAGLRGPEPVVVHNGVAESWHAEQPLAARTSGAGSPYVVYVGNVKPHKNLGTLVRAFASIVEDVPHDLLIVGRREGLRGPDAHVEAAAAALGGRVRFAGEANDEALRGYVAGAAALVMPSLYEGFGLPPLEAMAVGCPTLVARAASLPEVCGDAALYCDPLDPADMGQALRRLLLDEPLRESLRVRGLAHVRRFRWERTARETLVQLELAMAPA